MTTFVELTQDEIADLITSVTDRAELLSRLLHDDNTDVDKEVERLDNLIEKLKSHIITIKRIDREEE